MIYLAGSCSSEQRTLMVNIAKCLRENKYEVYCPFELKIEDAWSYSQEDWAQLVFNADKRAIDDADIFLMITPGRIGSAGTNWEQGYAFATKKPENIIVVQFTEAPTSIMTYCAAGNFVNTNKENLTNDILNALKNPTSKGKCTTTLT